MIFSVQRQFVQMILFINVQLPELTHLLSSLNEKTEGSRNRAGITIFAAWLKICYVIVIHEQ